MKKLLLLAVLPLVFAALASADVSMNLYAAGASSQDPNLGLDNASETAGQYFVATIPFNRVTVVVFNYGAGGRGFTMRLYPWVTNYATSVAQPVVAQQVFSNIPDNLEINMDFTVPAPAGSYLLTIGNQTGGTCGIWCYNNSGFNNAYAFENGGPADNVYDNNVANTPLSNDPHNFGQRFTIGANCEYATMQYRVYTYSANPGKAFTTYLYNWNANYATTVAGAAVVTQNFPSGVNDNSDQVFSLGSRAAGDYLMRLQAAQPSPTNIGWWRHSTTNNYPGGQAFADGAGQTGGYMGILRYNARDFRGYVTKLTPGKPGTPDLAAVDDLGTSNSDNLTSQTTGLTLSGTAEANSTVTIRDGVSSIGSTAANSAGAWSADVSLGSGAHSITVTATDAAVQTSIASDALVITVDTSKPDVTLSSAAGNPVNAPIAVSVSLSESVVSFGAGNVSTTNASVSGFSGSGTSYSFTLNPSGTGAFSCIVNAGVLADAAGNGNNVSNSISRTYDGTPPTAVCASPTVQLDASGNVTVPVASIDGGSTDNVAITTRTIDGAATKSFTCSDLGPQSVTLRVEDAAGNFATCQSTVTVADSIAPTVICPGSAAVNTDAGLCTGTVPNVIAGIVAADVNDNCTADGALLASLQQSPAAGTPGASDGQLITVTVTDGAGNPGTCTVTLDVNDTEAPTVNCPGSVSVNADAGLCTGKVPNVLMAINAAAVADNCTADGALLSSLQQSPAAGTPGVSTGQIITVTVTDGAGNPGQCTMTLTVNDSQPPTVNCPASVGVNADAGLCTATVPDVLAGINAAAVADNCTADGALLASLEQSPPAGTPGASDGQLVTVTVTDEAGFPAQCNVMLIVTDTQPPVVTPNAGATATVLLDTTFNDPGATASDNCGVLGGGNIPAGTCSSGDCSFDTSTPGNTWTIDYTASDINGNGPVTTSTVFTVTSDTTPPVFSNLVVTPSHVLPGETVAITFTSSEPLVADPDVLVDGEAATFVSSAKAAVNFEYSYTVPVDAEPGDAGITIMGMDLATNAGSLTVPSAFTIDSVSNLPLLGWPLLALLGTAGAGFLRKRRK